jgi:hypothetical protein
MECQIGNSMAMNIATGPPLWFLPDAFATALSEQISLQHTDADVPRRKEAGSDLMCCRGYEILELPTGKGLVIKRQADAAATGWKGWAIF